MKRAAQLILAILALGFSAAPATAAGQAVTLSGMPPVVIYTQPRAGDAAVDPATSIIKVMFSKNMNTNRNWSWVMVSKESFPQVAGQAKYSDARTCVLPVKLAPGRTYAIWINSAKHRNFKDKSGKPAVPYLLYFKTRAQ